ncbi:MAG: extracellular solute-binding protein [Candidatus Vogelbacteria bacterium]|nr:extracellular solute-binding protein [Candidatus Vogelbacteria bacterium]
MKDWFQIILLIVFGAALIIGVLVFSGIIPGYSGGLANNSIRLTLWGTNSLPVMEPVINEVNKAAKKQFSINYVYKAPEQLESDLVEALTQGAGPDLLLFNDTMIIRQRNKLTPFDAKTYPLATFKNNFVEGAQIFIAPEGVLALPLTIDPLMLYYNRDLVTNAGIVRVPERWSEVLNIVNNLTVFGDNKIIKQSAIALGESTNVPHAKDIVALLSMQAGTPITAYERGIPVSNLADAYGFVPAPAEAAIDFYTQFAAPTKTTYTWSRALPNAQDFFTIGSLALYLGYASERPRLVVKNPNLNFDAAIIPQRDQTSRKQTIGRFQGVAVVRSTKQLAAAQAAAKLLAAPESVALMADQLGVAPARRDLLAAGVESAFGTVVYQSALLARTWLDPDPTQSNRIFNLLIDAVGTGRVLSAQAVRRADDELNALMK